MNFLREALSEKNPFVLVPERTGRSLEQIEDSW
jgi:hypothetical protein